MGALRAASTRIKGAIFESRAQRFLQRNGLALVTRNFHCRHGEIDLVMRQEECLVFVEVRYRAASHFASAAESVSRHKQTRLLKAAATFVARNTRYAADTMRFDVVAFDRTAGGTGEIQWLRDAFRA